MHPLAKHHFKVASQAAIVLSGAPLPRHRTALDYGPVEDQEQRRYGKSQQGEVVNDHIEGLPARVQQKANDGPKDGEQCGPAPVDVWMEVPQVDALKDCGRQRSDNHVDQVVEEVPIVVVSDAAAGEPTVVIPLQYAHIAHLAVPGARRNQRLAIVANVPTRQLPGIHRWLQELL